MTNVDEIKEAITQLSSDEVVDLRRWFDELDNAEWDRQIEDDVAAGKLDALAEEALAAVQNGQATDL